MRIIDWILGRNIRRQIEADADFQSAEKFGTEYTPKSEVDYSWVQQHSAEEFRGIESRVDGIEAKADSLIKYLGAGSGIAALAATSAPKLQILPALALLLMAVLEAIRAIYPQEHPAVPLTKTALEFADSYERQAAGASFAAKLGVASVAMRIVAKEKARRVRNAFFLFFLAMLWLVSYGAIRGYR